MDTLECYRLEIDEIDKQMTSLFEKRMNLSKKICEYKIKKNMPVYQKDREDKVIKKNISYLKDKDYELFLKNYYTNIMYLSRLIQNKIINKKEFKFKDIVPKVKYENYRIGYQGVSGSFSEEAMNIYFKETISSKHYSNFEDLFIALKGNEIDYAIIPVENSSTGGISKVYDLLNKYDFYIVGEECIKINQNLVGIKGSKIEDIKEVYSHPQGFEQSSEFFTQYNKLKLIPYSNTAISAKLVSELNDKSKAAIASDKAAKIYNLDIIKENINDIEDNYTKFAIIGKDLELNSNCNKSSMIFSIEHEVGSLYNILGYFARHNINLTKIESRPIKNTPWKYLFYVDIEGNINDSNVIDSIEIVKEECEYFKFLGSYPKCKI